MRLVSRARIVLELSSRATDLLGQVETGMTSSKICAKSFVCMFVIGSEGQHKNAPSLLLP